MTRPSPDPARSLIVIITTVLALVLLVPDAWADHGRRDRWRRHDVEQGNAGAREETRARGRARRQPDGRRDDRRPAITRDRAARIASRATGGRVLGIRLEGGRYRIKVLVGGGRVRTIAVDAGSGALLD